MYMVPHKENINYACILKMSYFRIIHEDFINDIKKKCVVSCGFTIFVTVSSEYAAYLPHPYAP